MLFGSRGAKSLPLSVRVRGTVFLHTARFYWEMTGCRRWAWLSGVAPLTSTSFAGRLGCLGHGSRRCGWGELGRGSPPTLQDRLRALHWDARMKSLCVDAGWGGDGETGVLDTHRGGGESWTQSRRGRDQWLSTAQTSHTWYRPEEKRKHLWLSASPWSLQRENARDVLLRLGGPPPTDARAWSLCWGVSFFFPFQRQLSDGCTSQIAWVLANQICLDRARLLVQQQCVCSLTAFVIALFFFGCVLSL